MRQGRGMRGALLKNSQGEKHFRWRGQDISRVENLSDAVFGFSITLLVVSSAVPATYAELTEMLRLFVPFGVCMLTLGMIWNAHYTFFRRYGLNDTTTMLINGALLFVVVFYLYPLKFLVTMLFNLLTGRHELVVATRTDGDTLLAIYSSGYLGVFILLAAFYAHAWRRQADLGLTKVEELITRQSLALMLVHAVTAVLALILALTVRTTGMAGMVYFLIGPLSYAVGVKYGRQIEAEAKSAVVPVAESEAAPTASP